MHIAFLTPEYPHDRVARAAGIGTSIKNLCTGLQQYTSENIKITLFIHSQNEDAFFEEGHIRFHLIKKKKYRYGGFYLYRKYLNRYINKVIKKEGIQCIEAPDWTGVTAFMRFKIPLVIRLHGTDTYFCDLEGRTLKKKNFMLERNALNGADVIVSVSSFTAKKTKQLFGLKQEIGVIYNGIDLNQFKPQGKQHVSNTILYFGSVIRKKGVLSLARAFNKVVEDFSNAQLVLLGKDVTDAIEGESTIGLIKKILSEKARKNLLHITHVPYEEVKTHIQKAGVVCLPSYAEAFPMTWLEAMAMEKALVTSNIGWANEMMIHEETGLMIDPDDCDGLAQTIIALLEDPKQATLYGQAARKQLMTNFATETIMEQNYQFYQKTINL